MLLRTSWRAAGHAAAGVILCHCAVTWADEEPSRPVESRRVDSPKHAGLRSEISVSLQRAFPKTAAERRQQAKELVALYQRTSAAKDISTSERVRLQARLKSRLTRLAVSIERDVSKARRDDSNASLASATTSASPPSVSGGAPGGAPQDDGQELVDLIQATIAPQSWDVNGGQGTIVYWPAWHVLVVRQTDDVHEQIGGVVHAMRK